MEGRHHHTELSPDAVVHEAVRFFAAVFFPALFFAREEVLALVFFAVAGFEEGQFTAAEA
ncbi:hypothetical protein AB0F05_35750 [Streptomyces microflavus]|uniref:hypothetical protein n=1 Tax=Streptomyces microflavus TaxID=1919 RepID=UPI0033E1D17E